MRTKKIIVLGGGISGYGSAILAKKQGFDVFLSDAGRIADRFKARLDEWQVPYEEGGHTKRASSQPMKSSSRPEYPRRRPSCQDSGAGHSGHLEMEFAGRYLNGARCICITDRTARRPPPR